MGAAVVRAQMVVRCRSMRAMQRRPLRPPTRSLGRPGQLSLRFVFCVMLPTRTNFLLALDSPDTVCASGDSCQGAYRSNFHLSFKAANHRAQGAPRTIVLDNMTHWRSGPPFGPTDLYRGGRPLIGGVRLAKPVTWVIGVQKPGLNGRSRLNVVHPGLKLRFGSPGG